VSAAAAGLLAAASTVTGVAGARRLIAGNGGIRRPAAPMPVARTRAGRALGVALDRAGVPVGPDVFAAAALACAAVAACGLWVLLRSPIVAVAGAGAVLAIAYAVVASAERRYLTRFSSQLPAVAQQLASGIGAGLSLRQAIARTAADAPEPAAAEFRRVSADLDLGARVDESLEGLADRVPDPGLRIMTTAILVQRIVGGNLAGALSGLSARLEERCALEREARSATAQARMSAWLVAGLPLAGGVLIEVASPGTLARIVGRGPGLGLLVAATALECLGVLLVRRIVRREGLA